METVSAEPIVADTFAGRVHVEWVSEDAVRRAFDKIDERAGVEWLQEHLDYCTRPLLDEPWILDVDTTVKPLYGHQEGAVTGGAFPRKTGGENRLVAASRRPWWPSMAGWHQELDGEVRLTSKCHANNFRSAIFARVLTAVHRCGGELQPAQTGAAVAQLSQLHAGEPAAGPGGGGGAGKPAHVEAFGTGRSKPPRSLCPLLRTPQCLASSSSSPP